MAGFQDLPVELAVAIMKCVDIPQDIYAMTRADPWLLHCFLDNRKQVMTPHTTKILEFCESHVPTAYLLAARLRHTKQDPAFNDTRPQHREQIVSPILRSCISSHNTHHYVSYRASLSTICALSTLAIDVGWLATRYISQAREELFRYRAPGYWPRVSLTGRQWFINAACRLESYVQAFFYMEQWLFPRDESIRRLFFEPRLCDSKLCDPLYARQIFYSITNYVYDQHCTMIHNIKLHLSVRMKAIINHGDTDNTQVADERQRRRLRSSGDVEVNKYVHYLTAEGLGMLVHLQSMDLDGQLRFVLSNFESVVDSRHPTVSRFTWFPALRY